jgi:hypothetical protein
VARYDEVRRWLVPPILVPLLLAVVLALATVNQW